MTREEAIERIKARFDKWALDDEDMKAIQILIPEFSESEDERIREWLVNYFKAAGKSWIHRDISPEQILAWLEKQKERVPENEETGTRKEQKPEWSEEDEEKIVTISEIIEHCTTIPYSGGTLTLNKEYKKELLCFIKSLRPQYHGDVTMTEAYKMGLEAGKASSWKPSEEQQSGSSALKAEGMNE